MKNDDKKHRFVDSTNWEEEHEVVLGRLLDDSGNPEYLTCIYEDQWSITRSEPHCPKNRENPKDMGENPVIIFRNYIERGLLPPPEILILIDSMFETYLMNHGNRTLEDVFFGSLKKGVGNYAARRALTHGSIYSMFEFWPMFENKKYSSKSELAQAYLLEIEGRLKEIGVEACLPDVDTFLRQHRRHMNRTYGNADN